MFVPFVFTLDDFYTRFENYFDWQWFYLYADACIKNNWPIISHERYFENFSHIEKTVYGVSTQDFFDAFSLRSITSETMLKLKAYPISSIKESEIISKYASQFDCWVDLLEDENQEFERIIGELLDRITIDFGEKPEGILSWERLPKALMAAANKRGLTVILQGLSVLRPPFVPAPNAFSLISSNSPELLRAKFDSFISAGRGVPILAHKGLLRLFVSEHYQKDIHSIDSEPEYDVGVLYSNMKAATHCVNQEYVSDQEMRIRAKEKYNKVLIRTRPYYDFEPTSDALDDSPTCFHFCCKCRRILGFSTKGMFEAMFAGRIAHEYGSFLFHSFCNDGIEDESKGSAPLEFLNFVLFGLCTPFSWITDTDYLRFLISNPSEKDLYMHTFLHYTHAISQEDLEFYYMSNNRAYRLGDILYFTSGHKPHEYAAYYCKSGLASNSGAYTWSDGECTSFEFDLIEPVDDTLMLSVMLHEVALDWNSPKPEQIETCEVNGFDCASITLMPGMKYMRFSIPAKYAANKLQITFRYSYIHHIQEIKSAIAFKYMNIRRSSFRVIEDEMMDDAAILKGDIARLKNEIKAIYNTRSWKVGNGIMKAAAKIIPKKKL